ncbi:Histone deacetylase 6 [Castilleja foliolosa]|uniref:Histone deacetylase 6 n=1 Tax=Castilleja foliolosa TaxID=1961234 RepID=A0ABD3CH23_9LAMI
MTVSFHKFGHHFFPGTGRLKDNGFGAGKYYALNVPLRDGLTDDNFSGLFRPITEKVMQVYIPEAVVLQCGADSLGGDRLGNFNLSVKGHADCVCYLRTFNVPLMILGGGGYTLRNVARCWFYETAVAVDVEPDNELPFNEYLEYFGPDYTLHVEPSKMANLNKTADLENMRTFLLDQISRLQHVPSVQFQTPPSTTAVPEQEEPDMDGREKPQMWNGEACESDEE